jgi:hypothetical protein
MKRSILGLALVCACLAPAAASAQEAGKVGITMGYPAGFGMIWHASDKLAVRPEFTFAFGSSESTLSEADSTGVGLGVSVLFYTKKWDNAAAYVAPRFAWSHTNSESTGGFNGFVSEATGNAYVYSGSFGAQGWVGDHFSAYGEVGLGYSTSSTKSSLTSSKLSSNTFSIRSGVGVAFYF